MFWSKLEIRAKFKILYGIFPNAMMPYFFCFYFKQKFTNAINH